MPLVATREACRTAPIALISCACFPQSGVSGDAGGSLNRTGSEIASAGVAVFGSTCPGVTGPGVTGPSVTGPGAAGTGATGKSPVSEDCMVDAAARDGVPWTTGADGAAGKAGAADAAGAGAAGGAGPETAGAAGADGAGCVVSSCTSHPARPGRMASSRVARIKVTRQQRKTVTCHRSWFWQRTITRFAALPERCEMGHYLVSYPMLHFAYRIMGSVEHDGKSTYRRAN